MQSSMAETGEQQRLRYALCVGVVGDECQLIFADDLSSVTLRPRIGECRLGRWFRMASLPDQYQHFSLLEHENGPFTTRVVGDGFSKRVQVQLPICFVPDLSAFGWHAMNDADRNKFYSPHLEKAGQVWAMLDWSRIEPGHRYEALLSVEIDSIRQLPRWTLDSADDILGFSKLFAKTGSFGVPTSAGVVLRILPEYDRNGHCLVTIRRHIDARLAFGRIWNQNLSVGDIVDFVCIETCCRSLPLMMALDIAKSVQPDSGKVRAVEFANDDLFKLRVPLSAQLLADLRDNRRMAGSLELANHGTLLDVDNVIGQKLVAMPRDVEGAGGGVAGCSFYANIRARLCLVPEKITPLWVLVGIESVERATDFGDIEELSVQASTPMTASTAAVQSVAAVAATKQQQHVVVEAVEEEDTAAVDEVGEEVQEGEEVRLEEEALVLFTHIVRMDLYMRFFDDREGKFTRNKCCNRDDLPPNFDTSDPPMPGSWAHIVYTVDCTRDIQHIVIVELRPVDLATTTENLGAILRYAMMTVVPSNAHVWNTLLETTRVCTVQQLLSGAASEEGHFDDRPVNGVQQRANTNSDPTGVAEAEQPASVDDWGIAPDWQNVEYERPLVGSRNGKNCTGKGQNAKIEQKAKACVDGSVANDENSVPPLVPMSSSSWAASTSAPASRTPTPLAKVNPSAQSGSTLKSVFRKMAFANKETRKQKKNREKKERQQKQNVQQPENVQNQSLSTIVLFIKSVGFEQHMRFYCTEKVTFKQFRCCKRNDLPECPAVGTWARIVYTNISDQHIRVSFFKKLDYDENKKNALTWAMKLARPENVRVWNSLSDQKNDWPMWLLEKINRSVT